MDQEDLERWVQDNDEFICEIVRFLEEFLKGWTLSPEAQEIFDRLLVGINVEPEKPLQKWPDEQRRWEKGLKEAGRQAQTPGLIRELWDWAGSLGMAGASGFQIQAKITELQERKES
jgi:hypothetical protein